MTVSCVLCPFAYHLLAIAYREADWLEQSGLAEQWAAPHSVEATFNRRLSAMSCKHSLFGKAAGAAL